MACQLTKEHCQHMIDASNSSLAKEMEKTIPQFTTAVKDLCELDDKVSKEEWTLRFVLDATKNVCETELIHLVNEFAVYGNYK